MADFKEFPGTENQGQEKPLRTPATRTSAASELPSGASPIAGDHVRLHDGAARRQARPSARTQTGVGFLRVRSYRCCPLALSPAPGRCQSMTVKPGARLCYGKEFNAPISLPKESDTLLHIAKLSCIVMLANVAR